MSSLRIFEPSFDESMEHLMRRFMAPWRFEKSPMAMDIRVDIVEKDDSYQVRADLPGVNKEDIKVNVEGNLVQIDAETRQVKETRDEGGKVLRSERYEGALSRAFTLAQDIDDSKVVAKYADGVLSLELPKKAKTVATNRKITIE